MEPAGIMSGEVSTDSHLEIAHVLFIDIIGYSRRPVDEQKELVTRLNQLVRNMSQFRSAEQAGKLIRIPTGDGMALAFFTSPDAPVNCAIELAKADEADRKIELRMGIHSGPVDRLADVNERINLAGTGINMAQRVMDLGDAGHILLSQRIADDLAQYGRWQPLLHNLGEAELKHGVRLGIVSLYNGDFGNAAVPEKVEQARREREVAAAQAARRKRRRVIITIVSILMLALLIAAGIWTWERRGALASAYKTGAAGIVEKSIAILPFEYFGDDKDNVYLADGVQDDILTDLAKVADLKVISRRSVAQYRGSATDVREIGRALQVAYVLEGTVRKVGDKLRVTAQLIDTRTALEKWAEKYDRDFADIFAIQNEISEAITDQLKAVLTPQEKADIETAPTKDMEAYDLYLRARALANAFGVILRVRHENFVKAEPLLQAAIARDPKFVLAYCLLAQVQFGDSWQEPSPERIAQARANLETALKLAPESGEVHLQLGSFYDENGDWKRAEEEFRIAARKLPNSVVALRALANFEGEHRGRWKEALAHARRAAELDPRDGDAALQLAEVYRALRRYDEGNRILDNAIAFLPHESSAFLWAEKIDQAAAAGDTKAAMAAFDVHPFRNAGVVGLNLRIANVMAMQRRYDEAAALLGSIEEIGRTHNSFVSKNISYQRGQWELELGIIGRAQGQNDKARMAFDASKKAFGDWLAQHPEEPKALGYVAICDAALGKKEDAVREGRKAQELWPRLRDYHANLQITKQLALVYAWTGDRQAALALLQELAPLPDCLTYGELKLHPQWDDLRNEPDFGKVLLEVSKPAKID